MFISGSFGQVRLITMVIVIKWLEGGQKQPDSYGAYDHHGY